MKRNFQILFILLFVLTGIISPVRGKNKTGDCNIRFCTYNIRETCLTMASTPGNSGKTRYVK